MKQVALESPSDDVFIKSVCTYMRNLLHTRSCMNNNCRTAVFVLFVIAAKIEGTHSQHHKNKKFGNIPTNPHALLDYMQEHGFW